MSTALCKNLQKENQVYNKPGFPLKQYTVIVYYRNVKQVTERHYYAVYKMEV